MTKKYYLKIPGIFLIICFIIVVNFIGVFTTGDGAETIGTIRILPTKLPFGRYKTSAIWDGSSAFIFGGMSLDDEYLPVYLDDIVKFNPSTNDTEKIDTALPAIRGGTSAIWDGEDAYIFGGESWDDVNGREEYDDIIRYDPSSNVIEKAAFVKLPTARHGTSAIIDGGEVYIFGGYIYDSDNEIVRYNTSAYEVNVVLSTLPNSTHETSSIWDGENAYIFGGGGYPGEGHIVQYNPENNNIRIMNSRMPDEKFRLRTSAIWDGNYAYVFGGVYRENASWKYSDEILRYDTKNDNLTVMSTHLPMGREGTSAVWTGEKAYIFGGYEGEGVLSDEILEYIPPKADDPDSNNGPPAEGSYIIWGGFAILLLVPAIFIVLRKKRKKEN